MLHLDSPNVGIDRRLNRRRNAMTDDPGRLSGDHRVIRLGSIPRGPGDPGTALMARPRSVACSVTDLWRPGRHLANVSKGDCFEAHP
jgi:hypothetical protein